MMRVLVVNPNAATAKLVRFILSEAGHEVVLANRGATALDELADQEIDALLLEIDLPDWDGHELCRELRAAHFAGPIIFLTRREERRDKLQAFTSGADDYLVEPFDPEELVARIKAVTQRCKHMVHQAQETILNVGDAELATTDLSFQTDGQPPILLTPTETRVLECLMRNAGITLSRELLIARVWGYADLVDSNRLDVCIRRIRKKIERDPDLPEYVHTARGVGYTFRARPKIRSNGHHAFEVLTVNSTSASHVAYNASLAG